MNRDSKPASPSVRPRCALALMAKVPFVAAVKTRLTPPLTAEEAARLSICFLRDMTTNIAGLNGDSSEGVVLYTPTGAEEWLRDLIDHRFRLFAQRGETLGERLTNAAADMLSKGFEAVCLVNSDSPTLPAEVLTTAATLLAREGDRVVLGPSQDGGYYLIGLKHPHRDLFERIAWSTRDVLAHTIERATKIGLPVDLLPTWYDVDDAATLRLLCDELSLLSEQRHRPDQFQGGFDAPQTRAYLASLIARDSHERFSARPQTATTRA